MMQLKVLDRINRIDRIKNVSVVIAPYDMRKGRRPELERSPLKWYPNLCDEINTALSGKF